MGSSKEERLLERKEATQRKRRESFQDKADARRKVGENLQGNGLFYIFGPAIGKSGYGIGFFFLVHCY